MSRVGNSPIELNDKVTVDIKDNNVKVKGPKGELALDYDATITIKKEESKLIFTRSNEQKKTKALHGLYRALLANMVKGVTDGFEKKLEINGVGYKVQKKGNGLLFFLGYSHTIDYNQPEGIEFDVETETKLTVKGIDKAKVGQVAAEIRKLRAPEPYKGKGIKYASEIIRKKAGKSGKK